MFWPRTHYSIFLTGPFFLFLFFSFFLSFFVLFYCMSITLSIFSSCNLFRSNNFLASLAFIQAHSIYPIMASFLYTSSFSFLFYSFRPRYRPIVGLELLILLFYSLIKLTSLHRLGICCNNETLPVGSVTYKNDRQIQ